MTMMKTTMSEGVATSGKQGRERSTRGASGCCTAQAQEDCCEPAEKAACCGPSHGTDCGCQGNAK